MYPALIGVALGRATVFRAVMGRATLPPNEAEVAVGYTSSYAAKLKHPLWQRKRLEILQASEFTCDNCGATDKELHVHHKWYERGKSPWEYADEALTVLCLDCHAKETEIQALIPRIFALDAAAETAGVGFAVGWALLYDEDSVIRIPRWYAGFEFYSGLLASLESPLHAGNDWKRWPKPGSDGYVTFTHRIILEIKAMR